MNPFGLILIVASGACFLAFLISLPVMFLTEGSKFGEFVELFKTSRDLQFNLYEYLNIESALGKGAFEEIERDLVDAMLGEAEKLSVSVLAPVALITASCGTRSIRPSSFSSINALPKELLLPRLPPGTMIQSGTCQPRPSMIRSMMVFWPSSRNGFSELTR